MSYDDFLDILTNLVSRFNTENLLEVGDVTQRSDDSLSTKRVPQNYIKIMKLHKGQMSQAMSSMVRR